MNSQTQPQSLPHWHSPSDAEIAAAAVDAIECITTIPHEAIEISVRAGWLTLRGAVQSGTQKEMVEHIVSRLAGVKGVIDLIVLEPSTDALPFAA